MNKLLKLLVISSAFVWLGGCALAVNPTTGVMYNNIRGPIMATSSDKEPTRVGRASVSSFAGIVSTGDASIQTAMKNGGITEIHHIDYESQNMFGLMAKFTVVVYGD